MIVGRDTERLSEAGVTKAAVETVAEKYLGRGHRPAFYLALGGPVLGWVYKAVNTMDSMVGYKNEAYLYFAGRRQSLTIWPTSFRPGFLPG